MALGQGQQLHSAWMLDLENAYSAETLLRTYFLPQNKNSVGATVFGAWWFGAPPATAEQPGIGGQLHSAWMLDLEFHCCADRLLQTQFLPQNRKSAGAAALTNWWFGTAFLGQAMTASTGRVGVSIQVPLVGISISSTAGTLTPFGVSGVFGSGVVRGAGPGLGPFTNLQFTPRAVGYVFTTNVPLTGSAIASTAGTVLPTITVALTGSAMAATAGNLSPVSGQTVALVGQSFAATAGNVGLSVSIPLTGSGATLSQGTMIGGSGFRVRAVRIGFYGGIFFGPGDVFDILQSGDFSDSTIDYAAGQPGDPMFGWMEKVPASTPLTYPLAVPIFDYEPPPRRTVF